MKRFKALQVYLIFIMLILSVFLITGCGGGGGEVTEHWATAPHQDTTKPRVTAVVPLDGAPSVAINTKAITAAFSEAMNPATIAATGTFTLACPAGTPVTGAVTYLEAGNLATLTLPSTPNLPVNTVCTATITTAATDLAGNQLAGNQAALPAASNFVWSFTTGTVIDNVAPTVTLTAPADGATDVAINSAVNATFRKAMDPATMITANFTVKETGPPLGNAIQGRVAYDVQNKIATFSPSTDLRPNTKYTATITTAATDVAGNALAGGAVPNPWTFTTGTGLAPGTVPLGRAGTFGIMATASTASTGPTFINGDVALNPGSSQGIHPVQVNGEIHVDDQVAIDAQTDLTTAYNFAKALASDFPMTPGADQGASYPYDSGLGTGGMPPGVYTSESTMLINTPLTLNAGGNVNAVWVFQIGSSLTTLVGSPGGNVLLANGAQAKNVFFVPFAAATIGTNTTFNGSILAGGDITGQNGATINGRMLAGEQGAGAMVLENNTVNVPAP